MSFWSITDKSQEPLRENRWLMKFGNQLQNYVYALKTCKKPSFKIDVSKHVLINHTFNYPKKLTWEPIQISMVSVVSGDGNKNHLNQELLNIINRAYTNPRKPQRSLEGITKDTLTIGSVELIQVNADGEILETWTLFNCFISNVDYGALNYENEALLSVNFTLEYDYAELATVNELYDDNILQGLNKFNSRTENQISPQEQIEYKSALTQYKEKASPLFPNKSAATSEPVKKTEERIGNNIFQPPE